MSYPNNSSFPGPPSFPSPVLPWHFCRDFNFAFNIAGSGGPQLVTETYAELRSRFCEGSGVKPSEFIVTFDRNQAVNFSFQMR